MNVRSDLSASSVVARVNGVAEAEIDGEIVALNIDSGACYGMKGVASSVWRIIAEPKRVADIRELLLDKYEIDSDTCERQLLDLLAELRAEGLIDLVAGA